MVGIITYGAYIPRYRIKVEEITKVWGANASDITGGLGVFEKSVPDLDEDAATIAVEAARNALKRRNVDPEKIGAVYVGSESTRTRSSRRPARSGKRSAQRPT